MPRVFDCFTFFNELDILDVRLHEMSPVVDKFVLVEATRTFQGAPKPLYYIENKGRFAEFADKIIHVPVDFPDDMSSMLHDKCPTTTWAREHYQRRQIGIGLKSARGDDLILVSDVDEIVSGSVLQESLDTHSRAALTVFTMPIYSYFINRRDCGAPWLLGPRMIEFSKFTDGQKMRMSKLHADRKMRGTLPGRIHTRAWNFVNCGVGGRVMEIPNAGWHMSSIGSWENFRHKISAYSHEERKESDIFKSEDAFIRYILDTTDEVHDLQELPSFVQRNPSRFPLLHDHQRIAA